VDDLIRQIDTWTLHRSYSMNYGCIFTKKTAMWTPTGEFRHSPKLRYAYWDFPHRFSTLQYYTIVWGFPTVFVPQYKCNSRHLCSVNMKGHSWTWIHITLKTSTLYATTAENRQTMYTHNKTEKDSTTNTYYNSNCGFSNTLSGIYKVTLHYIKLN